MDLTLFELHLEDATFNAPFSGNADEESAESTPRSDSAGGGDDASGLDPRPWAALAVLVGLALLAKYLRSQEKEDEQADPSADKITIEES